MSRPLICLDLDETIICSAEGFVRANNPFFGTHITNEEYRENWYTTRWSDGYSEEEWGRKQGVEWAEYALEIGFYRDLPAMPGARWALELLAGCGARFMILTSRREEFREDSLQSLAKLFPNTQFEDYVSTNFISSRIVNNEALERTKGDMVTKIGADLLVDDQIRHVASTVTRGIPAVWFGEQPAGVYAELAIAEFFAHTTDGLAHYARTWPDATLIIAKLLGQF